jgi:hypothetical protein
VTRAPGRALTGAPKGPTRAHRVSNTEGVEISTHAEDDTAVEALRLALYKADL